MILAGEALQPGLVERWATGRRLVNAYGPTETTVWATAADCHPGEERPPIGGPVDNVVVRVLDGAGRLVPVGVPGELHIGGVALARGYLGRPALTAERFIPDPFTPVPGARLYRTGDQVRWRADGLLEFVGRKDRQVKVRGFRIEIDEVESALRTLDEVADCAVIASSADGTGLADNLVAYLVLRDGAVQPGVLRGRLAGLLPGYMIPDVLVPIDCLPLTANGKIDTAALPSIAEATSRARSGRQRRVPVTVAEQAVAALWADILHSQDIGLDDDFFAIGGNSIKATQVVSRVGRTFQVELPLRSVFEAHTVERFARVLDEQMAEQHPVTKPETAG
jgi:acyl-coenzyme A synthetase/AMP-(fatty) acid ligase